MSEPQEQTESPLEPFLDREAISRNAKAMIPKPTKRHVVRGPDGKVYESDTPELGSNWTLVSGQDQ